ncbi:nitrogen fixation protein NifS [Helicobacter sp. UBA3407]|uniref:nitrogen fixation protein NifS n=1 Tax=Helicobacter TaxID=209 RepID=UPI00261BCB55|nr:nitrogen fixation protein NifS [Helicobacter sp. UBA3407]
MLDRLQNPPLNAELNQHLIQLKSVNYPSITPTHSQEILKDAQALCALLGMRIVRPFSFNVESFYCLLDNLCKHFKVALALSSHNMLYCAYLHSPHKENIFPLVPDFVSGSINQDSINAALDKGVDCFILPLINEDILTLNPIESLPQNVLKVVDISYAVALNLPLPKADIMLLNGENLGIMRPFGVLAANQLDGISNIYLEIQHLYDVFRQAIALKTSCAKSAASRFSSNLAHDFFNALKANLKKMGLRESCYCFYPTPPNTLPLGLKGIKARNLIQSLLFDGLNVINGQECLFGFARPSFVLREMGYTQEQSRELLSLSFLDISPSLIPQIAQKIAKKYAQLRALG